MDYQTFRTRNEARREALRMRETGWPNARADRVETEREPVWVVCATHGATQCQYLRRDGYVR